MKTCEYRPLGTRVIVQILPQIAKSDLILPDGKQHMMTPATYEVIAVGDAVNDEKFSLKAGEIVLLSCHESEVYPISKEQKYIMVDRSKIVAALNTTTVQN